LLHPNPKATSSAVGFDAVVKSCETSLAADVLDLVACTTAGTFHYWLSSATTVPTTGGAPAATGFTAISGITFSGGTGAKCRSLSVCTLKAGLVGFAAAGMAGVVYVEVTPGSTPTFTATLPSTQPTSTSIEKTS
jgi:hypothetical protein